MNGMDMFPMGDDEIKMPEAEQTITGPVTIQQLEDKARELREVNEEYDKLKIEMDKLNEKEAKVQRELMGLLEAAEITSYKSKYGQIIMSTLSSVSIPSGDEKQRFFEYLKEQGIYDEVVSVNSRWLNSYYKKEKEAADARGDIFFKIPGLGEPFQKTRLSFKKGR